VVPRAFGNVAGSEPRRLDGLPLDRTWKMDQRYIMPPSAEAESARDRFPCPSCGSPLRQGAVLCPHCGTDLRKPALDPPEVPSTEGSPIWGPTRPNTAPADRRLARLSLVIAAIAVVGKIGLWLLALRAPLFYTLNLVPAIILGYGTTILAVIAVLVARQAVQRIDNTSDKRGLMTAQYALILGWAVIIWVIFSIVISPFQMVIDNIRP
jgi:zinc-ribbon domain